VKYVLIEIGENIRIKNPPTELPRLWRRNNKIHNLFLASESLLKKLGWYPVIENEITVNQFQTKIVDTVILNENEVVEINYKTEYNATIDEIKQCLIRKVDNIYNEKSNSTVEYNNNEFGIKAADKLNMAGTTTGILTAMVAGQPVPDFFWTTKENVSLQFTATTFIDFTTKIKGYLFSLNHVRLLKKHSISQAEEIEDIILISQSIYNDWPSNDVT
jgi:hypothetical protein